MLSSNYASYGYMCSHMWLFPISLLLQYIDTGQYTEAIVAFKTAISLQKDHSNAWTNLGLLYENLSEYLQQEAG